MAAQIVNEGLEPATTGNTEIPFWIDDEWETRSGLASPGTRRSLAEADRCLNAMNRIQTLLMRDIMLRALEDDDTVGVLAPVDVEALMLAVTELGRRAESSLERVRVNRHGCNG